MPRPDRSLPGPCSCLAGLRLRVEQPDGAGGHSARLPGDAADHRPRRWGYFVTVYFVRRGQLFPVTRPAPDPTTATALALLATGPDHAEAAIRLETAIAPQQLTPSTSGGDAVTIAVGRDFTSVFGDNQILPSAQLVWTVTGNAPSDQVRIAVDGKPIAVSRDAGLSRRPAERSDYLSAAPPSALTRP